MTRPDDEMQGWNPAHGIPDGEEVDDPVHTIRVWAGLGLLGFLTLAAGAGLAVAVLS